jgi:hypothetical protein
LTRKLQITLYVVAVYLGIFGFVFVFAPRLFEQMTQTALPDPKLTLLYGMYTLIFAFVALMATREKKPDSTLSLTILIVTLGNAVAFGHLLLKGMEGFAQAGPPLIVNSVLAVCLFLFRRSKPGHAPRDPR